MFFLSVAFHLLPSVLTLRSLPAMLSRPHTSYGNFYIWATGIIKKHQDGHFENDRKWANRVAGTLVGRSLRIGVLLRYHLFQIETHIDGWRKARGDEEVDQGLETLRTYVTENSKPEWEGLLVRLNRNPPNESKCLILD